MKVFVKITVVLMTLLVVLSASCYSSKDSLTGPGSDNKAPQKPSGLEASVEESYILLTWGKNTEDDLEGYNIYRSKTSGSGYEKLNSEVIKKSTNPSYRDSFGLVNGTTYYYVVTAIDESESESENSSEVSLKYHTDTNDADLPNGLTFVTIPGGTFRMGDIQRGGYSEESPVHSVTLSSFEMSIYEVTNAQYAEYLNEALASGDITAYSLFVEGKTGEWSGKQYLNLDTNDCDIDYSGVTFTVRNNRENNPVIRVTWYGAKAFAEYYGLDLPTEAEWEYACRAGTETKYYTGNSESDLGSAGWYSANYSANDGGTRRVGQKEPNAWGLYDMHGNVWELCNDWYDSSYYSSSPLSNPTGVQSGTYRVIRGGHFNNDADYCRSAKRGYHLPHHSSGLGGFRVVHRPGGVTY